MASNSIFCDSNSLAIKDILEMSEMWITPLSGQDQWDKVAQVI